MTLSELRRLFWDMHPEFKSEYRARKRQNEYNATIRSAWCAFVDHMHRDGQISDNLANQRATL